MSVEAEFTVWVAPNSPVSCRRESWRSTATMAVHPAIAAAMMEAEPTAPVPMTASELAASGRRSLS